MSVDTEIQVVEVIGCDIIKLSKDDINSFHCVHLPIKSSHSIIELGNPAYKGHYFSCRSLFLYEMTAVPTSIQDGIPPKTVSTVY